MGRSRPLSPAMVKAMWRTLRAETQVAVPVPAQATRFALVARGLLGNGGYDLTDAGRAWIAEQIEAAREDALLDNMQWHDARDDGIGWERAARLAEMWGTLPVQPQEINNDEVRAYREDDERSCVHCNGTNSTPCRTHDRGRR